MARQGRLDDAIEQFSKAVEIKPDYLEARFNLGIALAARGRGTEAMEQYQTALALAEARKNRAAAEAIRGQINRLNGAKP